MQADSLEHNKDSPQFGSYCYFFLKIFLCGPFFKVFIEFVTILLLFFVFRFWAMGHETLAPSPRIEPTPPALEGEVLTTGQLRNPSTPL